MRCGRSGTSGGAGEVGVLVPEVCELAREPAGYRVAHGAQAVDQREYEVVEVGHLFVGAALADGGDKDFGFDERDQGNAGGESGRGVGVCCRGFVFLAWHVVSWFLILFIQCSGSSFDEDAKT